MPIVNPIHLLEQAERLIVPPPAGPPRQVDLRRAVSSSYYAVFYMTLTALSDEFVGAIHRATLRYGLMHRRVDHRAIKDLCSVVSKGKPPVKYAPYVPSPGFGRPLLTFAGAFVDIQDRRHRADYDVGARYINLDALLAIGKGRSAVTGFKTADPDERRISLTLLLCPQR